jgi:alpha-mannosidase
MALQHQALGAANAIVDTYRQDDLSTIAACRKEARKIFGDGLALGSDIYKRPSENAAQVVRFCCLTPPDLTLAPQIAMSNCHIDTGTHSQTCRAQADLRTAWLWPFSATQQKVARSWSTQIDLMERYPEHRFVASQAQQYKWLEELYPRLFDRVRHKVATGEFQPIGGCWVEMDTNMPSGEALCRQCGWRLFPKSFF